MEKCIINWFHFGNLRDVYTFGVYDWKYNQGNVLYVTFTERKIFDESLKGLEEWRKQVENDPLSEEDVLKYEWSYDFLDEWDKTTKQGKYILFYIGKASPYNSAKNGEQAPLGNRLMGSYDRGTATPVFFFNIPATSVQVLVGKIQSNLEENPEEDLDEEVLEFSKEYYGDIEKKLISQYRPIVNKMRYNEEPKDIEFVHIGKHYDLFSI